MTKTAEANRSLLEVKTALHGHWRLYLTEGIVLVILGSTAIIVPPLASVVVAIFLGWVFLVGGVVGLVTSIVGYRAPGFWWALVSSLVTIVAGLALVGWPVAGAFSLTLVLTAFLIADGTLTILFGVDHRRRLSQRWGWILANGILDLILAGIIIWALPASFIWALGLIVGIDLVFGGWSLIAMALVARTPSTT